MRSDAVLWIVILSLLSGWVSLTAFTSAAVPQTPMISVGIAGYVDTPGMYRFPLGTHLSDAVNMVMMGEETSPPPVKDLISPRRTAVLDTIPSPTIPQSIRQITIRRDNIPKIYDLSRFLLLGEMSQNPLLKDGDNIIIKPVEHMVTISGAVVRPDEFEYLAGDKVGDLIAYAGGFKPEADLGKVILYRYDDNMVTFQTSRLDLSWYKEGPTSIDIPLRSGDRIMVPVNSQFRRSWKVTVEGHVHAPGEYLISDETTLYDILAQCGGPTSNGDLATAYVVNSYLHGKPDPDLERLKLLPISSMTPMEYNYMRTMMRQMRGKYSLNLQKTWDSQGNEHNTPMHDGDYIYVPERINMVWVSGQVRFPGLVPYVEGRKWKEYIAVAGGFTNNRRWGGVRIIRSHSGNWVKPDSKININPGDIILVAEQIDRDIWLDIKDVVLLTSQVLTIIIGIRAFTIK